MSHNTKQVLKFAGITAIYIGLNYLSLKGYTELYDKAVDRFVEPLK